MIPVRRKSVFLVLFILLFLLLLDFSLAATLKGSIYNSQLELETDVLVEVNTIPQQKFLSKDGNYAFEISPGTYNLTAQKEELSVTEEVAIVKEGEYVRDIFLLPSLEDDLWNDWDADYSPDELTGQTNYWYWLVGMGVLLLVAGVVLWWFKKGKKKPVHVVKKEVEEEKKSEVKETKTVSELKQELAAEPGYLDETIAIIKRYGGRIYQKELRKEMMHLSESKISLILTELEHKGKIEKIKKGRGNAIILKNTNN